MPSYRLLLLFLAINSALAFKKDTRLEKQAWHPRRAAAGCGPLRCPAVERPVCARLVLRARTGAARAQHVLLINKCELTYVKCYEGVEGAIVPMKNCGHNDSALLTAGKRSKREADNSPETRPEGLPPIQHLIHPVQEQSKDNAEDNSAQDELREFVDDAETERHANEESDVDYYNYLDRQMLSAGADGRVMYMDGADEAQYKAACPAACPARDVMACARCRHGVFRTFLSTCHARRFACAHPDEGLQLVTRLPCVMSAPYLSEASMQPRGRVREPADDDRVLRYLRCRDLYTQKSREESFKCIFDDVGAANTTDPYHVGDDY